MGGCQLNGKVLGEGNIAATVKRICTESPHVRILVLAHVRELISQNEAEMKSYWPRANTGIYSAGLGKRNTSAQIIFAGIQSVYLRAFEFEKIDIVVIDEAHMIPRETETRYGKFLKDLKTANPNLCTMGCTATPFRTSDGMLHEGKGALFDGICYVCDMKTLNKKKHLVPMISKGGVMKIDLSNVHLQGGDYKPNELAHAADDKIIVQSAVKEIVEYGRDRKAWLVFAAGVEHAEHVSNEIKKYGINSVVITGETPKDERDKIISDFRSGKIRCVCNVGVMTTGVNIPVCDLIALLTATKSTGRYVQMVGRGMRTHPDKRDCLLLDFGNNVSTHGMIDDVDPVRTRNVFNIVPLAPSLKECPNCHALLYTRTVVCHMCGYEYPVVAPHGSKAYEGAVMSDQKQPFMVELRGAYYSRHRKIGKPDILKIELEVDDETAYPLWCCLGHDGFAKEKALQIVKQFGGTATDVTSALQESPYWRKPIRAKIVSDGKFFKVTGIEFAKAEPKPMTLEAFT